MKWFWYSLIGFCLLMCSCKTQKLDSNFKGRTDIRSDLAYLNESVKISTQNHAYFANDTQRIVTEEDIIATEYDKETGKPTKETKTKRKITQDSYKVVTEEENQAVTNGNQLEVDHIVDKHEMVDSEVKKESRSDSGMFWKQFGKSFGIIMGFALIFGLLGRYLLEKFRVS
jgi:hypothetical protein